MTMFAVDDLLATARDRTGLSDFGPDDFLEGLTVLIDGINKSDLIRDDRRKELGERFLNILVNRLWFAQDLKDHPEIEDEDIGSPVIIASLPRTGSTKLQRVLGSSGDFQVLRLWSVSRFARIPNMPNAGKAERIRQTYEYEKWMYDVSPEIAKWHPMHTEEPEEDCFLMESTFRDTLNFGITGVADFMEWLDHADVQPAFDYFVSAIKYLQWQFPSDRHKPWLFKNPFHLGAEARLTQIHKNPRFIITHRDPVKCMPSVTHTMMAVRKMYSQVDTSQHLASEMLEACSRQTVEHIKWRDSNPDVPVLDLSFREVTQGGTAVAKKIYDFLEMDFSEASRANIQAWENRNPRDKHGRTSYSPDEIGMSDAEIRAAFSPYIDRFSAYME
ncbi:sulfotransferase family protein [Rhizorhabdus argentea]|uniref:sulfotransferase family protein n=1 Tax=Rhizorhabdus argentea TaxID=1387174 RepID=UPI0030EDC748